MRTAFYERMPTHPDRRFMAAALAEARAALEVGNLTIGAAIVHGDRVVALGRNAIDVLGNDTHHAELVAIQSSMGATTPSTRS